MEILYMMKMKNLFAVNIFFIGQLILLALFYNSLYRIKIQKISIIVTLIIALLILGIQFIIDPGEFLNFNLLAINLTSSLIVVYALTHLYNMLTEGKKFYYFSIGLVLYLLASTVLFLIGNVSVGLSNDLKYLSWMLNAFLVVVYQFFILYEWIKSFSKETSLINS